MINAIRVNNVWLVMKPVTPQVSGESSLFSYDGSPGVNSFPFTIPYEENAAVFGYPALPFVMQEQVEFDCEILFFNVLLQKGTLTILRATRNQIEINVGVPYFDIPLELFEKSILELHIPIVNLTITPTIYIDIIFTELGPGPGEPADTVSINTSYGVYNYNTAVGEMRVVIIGALCALINADNIYSGIHAGLIGSNTLRLSQTTTGAHNYVFITADVSGGSITRFSFTYDFLTWLNNHHDNMKVAMDDYAESGEIFPDRALCFPNIWNPNHYDDLNPDFTGWINYYHINQYFINYRSLEVFAGNKYTVVPFFFLQTVLKQIFDESNIAIIGKGVEEERFRRLIIDNNYSIGKEWFDPISGDEILAFAHSIIPYNHLPDMTVKDFLHSFCNKFNLWFSDYNSSTRTLKLDLRGDIFLPQDIINLSDVPFIKDPVFEYIRPTGFKLRSDQDTSDEESGKYIEFGGLGNLQHQEFTIGVDPIEIPCSFDFPSVQMKPAFGADFYTGKVPVKLQSGSGLEWGGRVNSFSPRLLIYKGLAPYFDPAYGGDRYCYATNDHMNSQHGDDDSQISLQWWKLYELFFVKWFDFEMSKGQCRIIFALPVINYINFKWDKWVTFQNSRWIPESYKIIDSTQEEITIEVRYHNFKSIN